MPFSLARMVATKPLTIADRIAAFEAMMWRLLGAVGVVVIVVAPSPCCAEAEDEECTHARAAPAALASLAAHQTPFVPRNSP